MSQERKEERGSVMKIWFIYCHLRDLTLMHVAHYCNSTIRENMHIGNPQTLSGMEKYVYSETCVKRNPGKTETCLYRKSFTVPRI
jgi:hypothetical protein